MIAFNSSNFKIVILRQGAENHDALPALIPIHHRTFNDSNKIMLNVGSLYFELVV